MKKKLRTKLTSKEIAALVKQSESKVASCSTLANMILDGLDNVKTKAIDLKDKRDLKFL